jgi:type II secretory pathway component GspD/PulD (secretin)
MKKLILQILAVCAVGLLLPAAAQNSANDTPDGGGGPSMQGADGSSAPDISAQQPDQGAQVQQAPMPAQNSLRPSIRFIRPDASAQTSVSPQTGLPQAGSFSLPTPAQIQSPSGSPDDSGPANLRLNFNNVQLEQVLSYLSDAAGFIIVLDTQVHGTVSVISSHPMTRNEAVDLLNSVLNQNGYAAIRNGRTLTIVNKDDAKTRDIPVQVGNDPQSIPKNDEIVTQIIPVRYVDASQLVSDLTIFVPQATIVANQAGNSIVITDTQENIHHLVEIISAIDSSAAGETEIRVFPLAYANPNDVAAELGQIFPSGSSGNGLSPIAFRGPGGGGGFGGGGFGGGGFGGGGGFFARMAAAAAANNGGGNRAQKQSQVTAVADPRTQSVIVMASKDLMYEIEGMMQQLDVPSSRDQQVHVIHLDNADPQQVLQVLQGTFPSGPGSSASSSSSSSQTDARLNREQQNATTVSQTSSSMSSGSGGGIGRTGGGGAP